MKKEKHKKKKTKRVKITGHCGFVWYCLLLGFVLIVSIGLSIFNQINPFVVWPEDYGNTIGVLSQVITSIISLVVSIIGIAISLQNEDFFGIKITKIYALRVKNHYSILAIIVISIVLSAINIIFYMIELYIAAIGTAVTALLFLFQVLASEVPIMSKKENAMLNILKTNMICCYIKKQALSKDLKDALKYLLYNKNLRDTYQALRDKKDLVYNQYLLFELLDIQQHLAFEMKDSYEGNSQRVVADSLLKNVLDVMFHHLDIHEEAYEEIQKNKHLLTRVLFRIHELPSMRKIWLEKVRGLLQCLEFTSADTKSWDDLISDVLIVLVAHTLQDGDFSIIGALRHQLSASHYCLESDTPALNVFAVISMYLYYLECCDPDVPNEIKIKVRKFIEESDMIEEKTKITSWKDLFSTAAEDFNVNYSSFISFCERASNAMEYYLFGNGAKSVVLSTHFFNKWYLTHLINAQRLSDIDGEQLCDRYPNIMPYLKDFGKDCMDENGHFAATEEMKKIALYFSDSEEPFVLFKIREDRNHKFFSYINNLRLEDLSKDIAQAGQLDNIAFAQTIHNSIDRSISTEWGFDPTLTIENESRYFSIMFEKIPEAYNFEETITKYSIDSVFADLRKATKKTILFNNESFESNVRDVLLKCPKYTTSRTKQTIPHFFIHDTELQKAFLDASDSMFEIESRILGSMLLLLDNSFRFNLLIEKVEINQLSEDEVAKKVDSYKRADGQFVYEGVFLPRDTITDFVRKRYVVLTVIIKHQVESSSETIYQLKPYAKQPEI